MEAVTLALDVEAQTGRHIASVEEKEIMQVRLLLGVPGCGHSMGGNLGPEPVSGWENPAWQLTDTPEAPTLMPSLGCPRWRDGTCIGHWWLRDGELVQA